MKPIQEIIKVDKLVQYVKERKNSDGGYCFYRLDESNTSDTFYAVAIHNILDIPLEDKENTIEFLLNQQRPDGTYPSIYSAWYSIKTLHILGKRPIYDPTDFLKEKLNKSLININPTYEVVSAFNAPFYILDSFCILNNNQVLQNSAMIIEWINSNKHKNGGYGIKYSSLASTFYAMGIFKRLDYEINNPLTKNFVKKHQVTSGGFGNEYGGIGFMDLTYYGVNLMRELNMELDYKNETMDFIAKCQNANGGFGRSYAGGISTLENSYYAINVLSVLNEL